MQQLSTAQTQKIQVNTTPQEAAAENRDHGVGCVAPCSIELKRNQDHIITISKEGFENQSVTCRHVPRRVGLGYILLPLGLIGAAVEQRHPAAYTDLLRKS